MSGTTPGASRSTDNRFVFGPATSSDQAPGPKGAVRLPVPGAYDLTQLGAIVGRLDTAHRAGAGAHHQGLGRGVTVVQVADAVEQVAVGDAGGREEDVVAGNQIVGVENPAQVVPGVLCGRALVVIPGPEAA